MTSVLRYGAKGSLRLQLPLDAAVEVCDAPRGQALDQVGAAVDHALQEPLEYPPLAQAVLAGDKVALAVEAGVPQAATLVDCCISLLTAADVSIQDIAVVCAADESGGHTAGWLDDLPGALRDAASIVIHDPSHRQSLSYLAASADGRPIYVNRLIHDADLVIPIGCLRLDDALGYFGAGVFPTFSDAASVQRFRAGKANAPTRHKQLLRQAEEVSWLLGTRFTLQVVPGAGGEVLHVLAGDLDAVSRAGARLCQEAWSYSVPQRAELVVATIEGGPRQQTWLNVARALRAASHAVGDGGSVALCTDLERPLGPALAELAGADDLDSVLKDIARHKPPDAVSAREVIYALKRGPVYLVSRLNEELVEDLGMAPVAADQLSRLIARYPSTIVLANAQYALAHAENEPHESLLPHSHAQHH